MKAKLQLTVKGRPVLIPIHLSEEQLKDLTSTMNIEDIASGWEEPQIGQTGYYENEFNEVKSFEITEETIDFAQKLYENDNFFFDYVSIYFPFDQFRTQLTYSF